MMMPCLKRTEIHHPFSAKRSSFTFHHHAENPSLIEALHQELAQVDILPGAPETILTLEDAFFVPGDLCIYDQGGERVLDSCVRRLPDLKWIKSAPHERISPPQDYDIFDDPIVYLGFLPDHWGHFLTEGVSRLWAFSAFPELRGLDAFYGLAIFKNPGFDEFFERSGFDRRLFKTFERPVKLRKCLVPLPSINNRKQIYTVHQSYFRPTAVSVLQERGVEMSDKPVYLSRSRFPAGRVIRRENELDERLAAFGVQVVYPELLTLQEQVRLFNSHRSFIGCWGSAFHNLLFALEPDGIETHMLVEHVPNMNYILFDTLLGTRANFVHALQPTPGAPQVWPNLDLTLDVDLVLRYCHERGLI